MRGFVAKGGSGAGGREVFRLVFLLAEEALAGSKVVVRGFEFGQLVVAISTLAIGATENACLIALTISFLAPGLLATASTTVLFDERDLLTIAIVFLGFQGYSLGEGVRVALGDGGDGCLTLVLMALGVVAVHTVAVHTVAILSEALAVHLETLGFLAVAPEASHCLHLVPALDSFLRTRWPSLGFGSLDVLVTLPSQLRRYFVRTEA